MLKPKGRMQNIVVFVLLFLGLVPRLYRINAPLADWHSWRQADTAAVARNFLKFGFDLLRPRFDDLSNIPSGRENPLGWRFVEFPIYNALHAAGFLLVKRLGLPLSFEATGRLVSGLAYLSGGFFLYQIVFLLLGQTVAWLTLVVFLFLPFGIYYSRTILPEPLMVMWGLGSIYFLLRGARSSKRFWWGLLSLFFAAAGILTKPFIVFLLLPSWLVIGGEEKGKNRRWVSGQLLALIPFLLWRWWMQKFPEGIPANRWLLNLGGIRFRPAWWRWLFVERLAKLILGCWGLVAFVFGLASRPQRRQKMKLFYGWLTGIFLYLSIFARGNVQHDYYQVLALPVVAVFAAQGSWLWWQKRRQWLPIVGRGLLVTSWLFAVGASWHQVREFYRINHPEIVRAGKIARRVLPPDAKVIAPYNGDTAFLYQINRPGWPAFTHSLTEMKKLGATHLVAVSFTPQIEAIAQDCKVLYRDPQLIIIDLRENSCGNL